jgi:hypothetical protein
MLIAFNFHGLVTTLIYRSSARGMVAAMPSLRVNRGDPVHEMRQVSFGVRPYDQVPVIGQYGVRQQPERFVLQGLP